MTRTAPRRRPCRPGLALTSACAILLSAGCAARTPARTQTDRGSPDPRPVTIAARPTLAARYLAIAQAGNRRLDHDFDALDGRDHDRLAAALADLRDIAATERRFDRQLAAIPFPPPASRTAGMLITANQARAQLTQTAASSTSLRQLHARQHGLDQANAPVEQLVRVIRRQLGLPPPATS